MKCVVIEGEDFDCSRIRIDKPVFPDSGSGIERAFCEQVVAAIRRAQYFNKEIGRAFDTARHDLDWSARKDDEYVWLHGGGPWDEDIDRRGAPPSTQILYERDQEANKRRNHKRMSGAG